LNELFSLFYGRKQRTSDWLLKVLWGTDLGEKIIRFLGRKQHYKTCFDGIPTRAGMTVLK